MKIKAIILNDHLPDMMLELNSMIHSRWPAAVSDLSSAQVVTLTLESSRLSVIVTHDGFRIGTHQKSDLRLSEATVPPFHSVIHMQRGAIWIEATQDDITLNVNDCPCRRLALRDGDRIQIGTERINVGIDDGQTLLASSTQDHSLSRDLAAMNAEELCDLISSEQSLIQEFTAGKQSGWDALLHAIESVRQERLVSDVSDPLVVQVSEGPSPFDDLLGHIDRLHQLIVDRNKELSEQEAQAVASALMIDEKQQQMTTRLNEILGQLNTSEPLNELRASA